MPARGFKSLSSCQKVIPPCDKTERKAANRVIICGAFNRERYKGLINPFCSRKRCGHIYYANATDKALAGEVQGLAEIILSQGGKSIGGVPTDWWDASGRKYHMV